MIKPTYDVRRQLAGFSGSSQWVRSYKSLAAAKKRADEETGYGAIGVVVQRPISSLGSESVVYTGTRS